MFHFLPTFWLFPLLWICGRFGWRNFRYLSNLDGIIKRGRARKSEQRLGSPDEIEGMDFRLLAQTTADMESLGFAHVGDLVTFPFQNVAPTVAPIAAPGAPPLSPARFSGEGFGRVLTHPTHGCLAVIIFSVSRDAQQQRLPQVSFLVAISSHAGFDAGAWSYSTGNGNLKPTAKALMKLWRHPRRLSTSLTQASAVQLLEKHLARREQIARLAGISWKHNLGMVDQMAAEKRTTDQMRATFMRLTPLAMAWQMYWLKHERYSQEWLGELKGRLN